MYLNILRLFDLYILQIGFKLIIELQVLLLSENNLNFKVMKKTGTIILLLVAVLLSVTSKATGFLTVNVIPGSNERALVSITNGNSDRLMVEVKNSSGTVVYFRSIKTQGNAYNKMYDFSNLEDGSYSFKVSLGGESEVNTLTINDGEAQITKTQEELAPYFSLKGDKLELSYLNFAQNSLILKVYDNFTNDLLYEENIAPNFVVNKAWDFSKLMVGKYTAVLETNDNSYTCNINLK